jgi:hypothetical protein
MYAAFDAPSAGFASFIRRFDDAKAKAAEARPPPELLLRCCIYIAEGQNMKHTFLTIALAGLGALSASAYAVSQGPEYGGNQAAAYNAPQSHNAPQAEPGSANPGTVNYVEGSVFLDGNAIAHQDIGRAFLEPGETLSTQAGKAELLLTPGVFLRLGDNSSVKMIAPDLEKTQVELEKGRAAIEVDQLFRQNDLEILDGGVTTQIVKPGFYEFDADRPTAMVFEGEAQVSEANGKWREIKAHHDVRLVANAELKSTGFATRDAQDALYNWSSLRSQYLAEGNNQIAGEYAGSAGFVPGWYWNPYGWDYTFIGLGPYWSPFGFGFYPPWGWYGGYWRGGYYGGRFYGRGGAIGRGGEVGRAGFAGGFHGGFAGGGGFHGGGGGGRR